MWCELHHSAVGLPETVVYQCRMLPVKAHRPAVVAGVLGLLLTGVALTPAAAEPSEPTDPTDDATSAGPSMPADAELPDTDAEWYDLAEEAVADAEGTDWGAVAQASGCELVSVTVTEVVDPVANAAQGAPEDLAVPVIEREEDCGPLVTVLGEGSEAAGPGVEDGTTDDGGDEAAGGDNAIDVGRGSDCSGTDGPGTVCTYRSGSYVTTSFRYSGSGTIRAFLKIYDIPTSASGCPTGTGLATGGVYSYSDGTRRTVSVYSPRYDAYSGHVWKYVGVGVYTNWGAACGII